MRLILISACLVLTACKTEEAECEADTFNCDGTMLQECAADGTWLDKEYCAEMDSMMCHAEMGHCMAIEDTGMPIEDTGMPMSDSGMDNE